MLPDARIKSARQLWPLGLITSERGPWLSKVGTTILAPNDSPEGKRSWVCLNFVALVIASVVRDDLLLLVERCSKLLQISQSRGPENNTRFRKKTLPETWPSNVLEPLGCRHRSSERSQP